MITGTITGSVAPTIAEKSLPLTPQQSESLRIAHLAQSESAPVAGEHGRVLYTFGEGIPTIITAPEQLSEIDLEPGEQIQLDMRGLPMLDLGDWSHWTVTPRLIGSGERAQAFLIVKPQFSGQETTLTVQPTNGFTISGCCPNRMITCRKLHFDTRRTTRNGSCRVLLLLRPRNTKGQKRPTRANTSNRWTRCARRKARLTTLY